MAIPDIKPLLQAIYTKLAGVSALTGKLGTYKSLPCIFFSTSIPSAAPRPYIHVEVPSSFTQLNTKNSYGWELQLVITAVADEHESIIDLTDIVDLIIENLQGVVLTLSSGNHLKTDLLGIIPAVTSNDLAGMRATFSFEVSD